MHFSLFYLNPLFQNYITVPLDFEFRYNVDSASSDFSTFLASRCKFDKRSYFAN